MDLSATTRKIIEIFYPPRCVLCQRPGFQGLDLCLRCYHSLPWNESACCQCALPLAMPVSSPTRCGRCLVQPPAFDSAFSLLCYQPPVPALVQRLKFKEKLSIARLFSQLLLMRPGRLAQTECLLPVPLHDRRLRQRGFNQSQEIARPLAAAMQVPLDNCSVRRVRDTPQQSGLDAGARRANIKGAFQLLQPVSYKTVTIVDDVITTGSTINELARVLKKGGVRHVQVLSVARAAQR